MSLSDQRRKHRLMDRLELPYARAIIRSKNKYIRAVAEVYELFRALPDEAFREHQNELFNLSRKYHERTIRAFSGIGVEAVPVKGLTQYQVKQQVGDIVALLMAEWVNTYGAQQVLNIATTTRDDVQRVISNAVTQDNPQATAQDILRARGYSSFRASTIARTEIHNAAMFAEEQSVAITSDELGIQMKKKWVPVQDERTRFDHSTMLRHPSIGLDEDFTVGGEQLSRPGDPRGSAGNIINCRCTLVYEQEE